MFRRPGSLPAVFLAATAVLSTTSALRPFQENSSSADYVGDEVCAGCHPAEYESFKKTAMGRSIAFPGTDGPHSQLSRPIEFYSPSAGRHYSVFAKDGRYFHRERQVDEEGHVVYDDSREVAFSVGAGINGWSFLIEKEARLYLSPISYYSSTGRWDLSPGYSEGTFRGFTRPISIECLACHSGIPAAVPDTVNLYRNPPFEIFAIGCERCHGPASAHLEAVGAGDLEQAVQRIVNPARLEGRIRDNVCEQCHLRGEARVLQPGKGVLDFRPGRPLEDTVAVFAVPLQSVQGAFPGVSHGQQLRSSVCSAESGGKLGCITCHNPHDEPKPDRIVEYYRFKCLQCHTLQSCAQTDESRSRTRPADNCLACHMPKSALAGIPHSVGTDHRILRLAETSGESSGPLTAVPGAALLDLTSADGSPADLRTRVLAYAQVARFYPEYRRRGYSLLKSAAEEFAADREVQETYGLIELEVSNAPEAVLSAARALQKAVDLGSLSANVHYHLARIRLQSGQPDLAISLLEKAFWLEPHFAPAVLLLSRLLDERGNRDEALTAVSRALEFNPGDSALRLRRQELQ